jgi:hypothetical protein
MARTAPDEPRRLPKRIAELTLPAPYDDFHVTCWINAPQSLWRDVTGNDGTTDGTKRAVAALQQIVVGHDLVDFDGEPYADGDTFWNDAPSEVGALIVQAIQSQIGVLSKPKGAP